MSPEQLKAWRMTLPRNADGSPATRKQAAEMLNGTPPNSYCDWEAGRRRIPRMLSLACEAVSYRQVVSTNAERIAGKLEN